MAGIKARLMIGKVENSKKPNHAWVEYKDRKVIDNSNGKSLEIDKALYYALGGIDPDECNYYSPDEVLVWILKTSKWGPWEGNFDTIKLYEDNSI